MIFTYKYIARQLDMSLKCVVCGEPLLPRAPNFFSVCKLPCHKKCANKHKTAPCDRCRAVERAQKAKQSADLDGSKRAASNMRSSARLTPGSSERRGEGSHLPPPVSGSRHVRALAPHRLPRSHSRLSPQRRAGRPS